MSKPLFQGICTALVTPFEEGHVNLRMLKKLLNHQMDEGIRAFVICGTTGEAPTLSAEEKRTLFRAARDCVKDRAVILAGTGSNCTADAVSLSRQAEEDGADGLLVVSPYYNKATDQGLITHYRKIAEAVSIPVILYNVPSRTGVDIPVSVYQALSEIPNIVGVKEASRELKKVAETLAVCGENFSVWSGNDDLLLPVLALGGKGLISVASNVVPRRMKKVYDLFEDGCLQDARREFLSLLPLIQSLFSQVNPIPVKYAMEQIGFDCGGCRLPLTDLSFQNQQKLQKLL